MKNINCLFIGLGSIGQRHLRNLKKILNNKIKFYAFRKTRHVPLINQKGQKVKGSIEKKFNIEIIKKLNFAYKKNIDLVFITNPSSMHIHTILSLKNLKNAYIFVEKPIDKNLKKINKLKFFLKKNNNKIFVGFNLKLHPGYQKLKKEINNDKKLGKLNYCIFKYGENLKNFHKYEDYKISYAANKKLGGGVCLTSIHEIDLMLDLFKDCKIVNSHIDNLSKLKIDVEDFSVSTYKCTFKKKKIISLIILDFFQLNTERYIKLIFDYGEVYLDLNNNYLLITKKNSRKIFRFPKNKNIMYKKELQNFLSLFMNRKKVPEEFSLDNSLKSLKIVEKIKNNHN